jgi:ubiquinone/menaquinone biosynthesis C-methylase UbiE
MAERAHPDDPGFQDRWFGLVKNRYKKKLYERYRFCLPYIKRKDRVLDVPCGVGWGTSLLKGARKIIGMDISQEAVDFANKRYCCSGREFIQGDMKSLPFPNSHFDVLICLEGFEHVSVSTGRQFLHEAQRVLVSGGILLMTCPILDELGRSTGNPYHIHEYLDTELVDLVNFFFRILYLERIAGPDGPEYKMVLANVISKFNHSIPE